MAEISAQLVKELRDRTGAGMMECKKALSAAGGDLEKAVDELRKRGAASADKKASRSALQGAIGALVDPAAAVLVEVNCESDFVARTDDFQALISDVALQVAAKNPESADALLALPSGINAALSIGEFLKQTIARLGENMVVARFARFAASEGAVFGTYIHPGSQLGVMVEVNVSKPESAANTELLELVKDLAMQVAAADPKFVFREDVSADVLARESEIARERARNEGKPDKILDRIVQGRLDKFFEEVCLTEQPFIKENSTTIGELLKSKGGKIGDTIRIARFARFKVGETAAAADAAAE